MNHALTGHDPPHMTTPKLQHELKKKRPFDSPFEEAARDMDVVFDTVGGDTLARSWGILKPHGRLVTIASENESTSDERAKAAFFIVAPDRQQLVEVGRRLDVGGLLPPRRV